MADNARRLSGSLIAAAAVAMLLPVAAAAEPMQPAYASYEQHVTGRVISSEPWRLRLDRGPAMVLHPGTVIKPRGLTLRNGMHVRVYGHIANDGVFAADEIDLLPPEGAPYPSYARPY